MTAQPQSASIYVGDLSSEVNESTLFEIFNAVGPVMTVKVARNPTTHESKGYAFVNFSDPKDAERALDTMNFASIKGQPCRIMWANRDKSVRDNGVGNIVIKNLDESIDNKTLYDTFSMFGNILSCKVGMDRAGNSLGYGFVHYDNPSCAQTAIEKINGMVIAQKEVTVEPYVKADKRVAQSAETFTNVYVKNIPATMSDDQLKSTFSAYGSITSSLIPRNDDGTAKGYAYINFLDNAAAKKAVDANNGESNGLDASRAISKAERKLQQQQRSQGSRSLNVNLYVKNLDAGITEDSLKTMFSEYGEITSVKVMTDKFGASRGFGFVNFKDEGSASKAMVEMNGKDVEGKELYVGLAQTKAERSSILQKKYAMSRKPQMPGFRPPFPGFPASYPIPMRGFMPPYPGSYGMPPPMRNPAPLQPRNLLGKSNADMKQMIGEKLYAQIQTLEPQKAGKITGMLLEMDHTELLHLLDNREALLQKVNDAKLVLQHSSTN